VLIKVVPQRHAGDCGVACLSMFLAVDYDEVLIVVGQVAPRALKNGMYLTEMIRVAEKLGTPLVKRRYHPEMEGILRVQGKGLGHDGGHAVVQAQLADGLAIVDPEDGLVYPDVETYLALGLKPTSMLVRGEP
jgi:ABC-type bacteriocin/lantibiotic exporter with double-glycine peptidase domain